MVRPATLAAHFAAHLAVLATLSSSSTAAGTVTYTSSAAFFADLSGPSQTLDFESLAPETLLPSAAAVDGVIFTYAIDGLTLKVTSSFDTTSPTNALGLTGGDDALLDGDEINIGFDTSVKALGMFLITSDPVLAGEIRLVTTAATAFGSDVSEGTLPDGGIVYFLGLQSTEPFSSALIGFADDGEINFAYNVDDITTAVPAPRTLVLAGSGLAALGALRRRSGRQSR